MTQIKQLIPPTAENFMMPVSSFCFLCPAYSVSQNWEQSFSEGIAATPSSHAFHSQVLAKKNVSFSGAFNFVSQPISLYFLLISHEGFQTSVIKEIPISTCRLLIKWNDSDKMTPEKLYCINILSSKSQNHWISWSYFFNKKITTLFLSKNNYRL